MNVCAFVAGYVVLPFAVSFCIGYILGRLDP